MMDTTRSWDSPLWGLDQGPVTERELRIRFPSRRYHQSLQAVKLSQTLRRRIGKCENCGSKKKLELHHKDGNTFNNMRANLLVLCHECHTKVKPVYLRIRNFWELFWHHHDWILARNGIQHRSFGPFNFIVG